MRMSLAGRRYSILVAGAWSGAGIRRSVVNNVPATADGLSPELSGGFELGMEQNIPYDNFPRSVLPYIDVPR